MGTTRDSMILEQAYSSNHKVRTIEDLWNIPLEPTNKPIQCVPDTFQPNDGIPTDDKLKKMWILYNAFSPEGNPAVWAPTLDTFSKRFRWGLYTKLLRWGLI